MPCSLQVQGCESRLSITSPGASPCAGANNLSGAPRRRHGRQAARIAPGRLRNFKPPCSGCLQNLRKARRRPLLARSIPVSHLHAIRPVPPAAFVLPAHRAEYTHFPLLCCARVFPGSASVGNTRGACSIRALSCNPRRHQSRLRSLTWSGFFFSSTVTVAGRCVYSRKAPIVVMRRMEWRAHAAPLAFSLLRTFDEIWLISCGVNQGQSSLEFCGRDLSACAHASVKPRISNVCSHSGHFRARKVL